MTTGVDTVLCNMVSLKVYVKQAARTAIVVLTRCLILQFLGFLLISR